MSQLNLPHGTDKKVGKNRKTEKEKRLCSEVSIDSPGNAWTQS